MNYKKIDLEKLIVIDLETLKNCFIACCLDVKTGGQKVFTFYNDNKYKLQPFEFWKFLNNCKLNGYTFVTFNGLGFDMQILDNFYNRCISTNKDKLYEFDIKYIIDEIYILAQELIKLQNLDDKYKYLVHESKLFLPTIDLFKQLHYDRPAKATSLKWIEFSMQYPKIQEMPIDHTEDILEQDVQDVIDYCWNDVLATKQFFDKIKHESELRLQLSNQYNLDLINSSEPKMAREIFGKYLCNEMKIEYKELRQMKTIRNNVKLKDIVFPYIKFLTPELQEILEEIKNTTVNVNPQEKSEGFSKSFNYNGLKIDLGLGGIHSCIKEGVYSPEEDEICLDQDITSMYPQICIQNKLKPEHLPDVFYTVYENLFLERKKYNKKDPRNYIIKICLNSLFGLSAEINSFVYDKALTYSITVNGQLLILMYVEALYKAIPSIKILQKNTDGITYIIKKKNLETVKKVQKWWENITKLSFEDNYYEKMIINDVNNYIGVNKNYSDFKCKINNNETVFILNDKNEIIKEYNNIYSLNKDFIKKKGLFETEMAYHKNPSALIIPKALEQYFINNLTVKDFIVNKNNSIFDYCLGVKKKSNFKLNLIRNYNFAELITEQQKVCRYIISKDEDSGLLVKDFDDGRRTQVQANTKVLPLDVITNTNLEAYNINYDFYIKKAKEIIEKIEPSVIQQTLF